MLLKVLVNVFVIGFYGFSLDKCFFELSIFGNDFFVSLCECWEVVVEVVFFVVWQVILWIGIVLVGDGGVFGKMFLVFCIGFGGLIGSGW